MNGKHYCQSFSILRLVGKVYGGYPEDPYQAWKVDSILDGNKDFEHGYWMSGSDEMGMVHKLSRQYAEEYLPRYFRAMTKRLEENKGQEFIFGKTFSIADASCAQIAFTYIYNELCVCSKEFQDIIDNYPVVVEYFQRLGIMLSGYLSKRDPKPF